jgi:hypothetical protein
VSPSFSLGRPFFHVTIYKQETLMISSLSLWCRIPITFWDGYRLIVEADVYLPIKRTARHVECRENEKHWEPLVCTRCPFTDAYVHHADKSCVTMIPWVDRIDDHFHHADRIASKLWSPQKKEKSVAYPRNLRLIQMPDRDPLNSRRWTVPFIRPNDQDGYTMRISLWV